MARAATVDALRKRNIAKADAEILADAGFTVEKLQASKLDALTRYLMKGYANRGIAEGESKERAEKVARRVLEKLGALEPAKPVKATKASKKAEEEAAEEKMVITFPKKVPQPGKLEEEIGEVLKELHLALPRSTLQVLAEKLKGVKLPPKKMKELLSAICDRVAVHSIDPNESAGILSAQSIGEPGTQMSLPYRERVLVREHGNVRVIEIGQLVDAHLEGLAVNRDGDSEWADLPAATLEVPSLTADGKVVWKPVRSISRHVTPKPLIRLLTRSGRSITATANHSFVTRESGTIVPVLGSELRPGDHLPVVRQWTVPSPSPSLDLASILPKEDFWYGSELAKARSQGGRWRQAYGHSFTVPVLPDALHRQLQGGGRRTVEDGFVYPTPNQGSTRFPERPELDDTLGWLVGAYLSEGWAVPYEVNISNTDERFLARTRAAAARFGLGSAGFENDRGFGHGYDLHIRSKVLSEFLKRTCGAGSAGKRVPDFTYGAADAFVSGLLRGYFEGDGNVAIARGAIRASSNSQELIDGLALLLTRFGILSSKGRTGDQHTLWIPARFATVFRDRIGFESEGKSAQLDALCALPPAAYTYDSLDVVAGFGSLLVDVARRLSLPTRIVNSATKRGRIGRATLSRLIGLFEDTAARMREDLTQDLARLRALRDEDVTWDEIVAVETLPALTERVYDFSVPGLETFTTAEGIVTHNTMRTFHYAGVAEMNVTLGLPRLIEIVDARRVPSTPIMEIHLKTSVKELAKVKKVATDIEMTSVEDIAELETDTVNMRVVVYPDEDRMRSRGLTNEDLKERLEKQRKFTFVPNAKRQVGDKVRTVPAFTIDAGEPSFKKLQKLVDQVRFMKIKGIDDIKRAIIRRRGEGFVIYTEGSNLEKVLELDAVDPTSTTTNSIQEIYAVLGVEAARNSIIKEAYDTLHEQGLTVDIRHIMMVADIMTNDGDVKAIGRHGISGRKSSVLARAAFEITAHHLLRAAVIGEVDYLDGVAENVIVGQPVTLGTGAVNLVYRPPKQKVAA